MEMLTRVEARVFEIRPRCIEQRVIGGVRPLEKQMTVTFLDRPFAVSQLLTASKKGLAVYTTVCSRNRPHRMTVTFTPVAPAIELQALSAVIAGTLSRLASARQNLSPRDNPAFDVAG